MLGVSAEFYGEMVEDGIKKMEDECNLVELPDFPHCMEMWARLERSNNRREIDGYIRTIY